MNVLSSHASAEKVCENKTIWQEACPLVVQLPPETCENKRPEQEKYTACKHPVVNELLCFVHNRLKILPVDYILKLCQGFYNDDAIVTAKRILYNNTEGIRKSCIRYIKHKGQNKIQDDLKDIVTVLRSIELRDMPEFVAKDLSNLPPLTALHTDVVSLYQEVEKLKQGFQVVLIVVRKTLPIYLHRCSS